MAVDNFSAFKKLMQKRNAEMNQQAMFSVATNPTGKPMTEEQLIEQAIAASLKESEVAAKKEEPKPEPVKETPKPAETLETPDGQTYEERMIALAIQMSQAEAQESQ